MYQKNGDNRPIIFVEYSHSMGNSNGNMKEFWDIFRSRPRLIGGCIWEFKDHGIIKKDSLGNDMLAYGGDFGEKRHDGNFCIDGIAASDGRPKAAMYECKRVYQPVECSLSDAKSGLLKISNRHAVKSLSSYAFALVIRENGRIVKSHQLPSLSLAAGKDTVISIRKYFPSMKAGNEYLADIHFTLSADESWAPKGHEVASNQVALTPVLSGKTSSNHSYPTVSRTENDRDVVLSGKGFKIKISKDNGALYSYEWNGEEQIFQPLLPCFTRPQTDNDKKGWKPQKKLKEWYQNDLKLEKVMAEEKGNGIVVIKSNYTLIGGKVAAGITYTINGDGVLKVDYSLNPSEGLPNIPKVGLQCGVKRNYDLISWYGKGPLENYVDRRYGFDAAIYSLPLEQFMEPYVYPQENGNRTDVRWMYLKDKNKDQGLMVVADSLLSMSARPYTDQNIEAAKHQNKLKDAGYLVLNIDLIQMGIGGNDSWSDVSQPLPQYQIQSKPYNYSFYILPAKVKMAGASALSGKVKF